MVRLLVMAILRTRQSLVLKVPKDIAFLAKSLGNSWATLGLSLEQGTYELFMGPGYIRYPVFPNWGLLEDTYVCGTKIFEKISGRNTAFAKI